MIHPLRLPRVRTIHTLFFTAPIKYVPSNSIFELLSPVSGQRQHSGNRQTVALAATARPPTEFQCRYAWPGAARQVVRSSALRLSRWLTPRTEMGALLFAPPPPRPLPCQPQRWWQQRAATAVAAAATDGSGSGALTSTGRLADTRVAIRRDGNPHRGEWAMPLPGVTGCALEFYSPSFPCAWTSLRRGLAPVRCPPAATPSPSFRPPTGALSA